MIADTHHPKSELRTTVRVQNVKPLSSVPKPLDHLAEVGEGKAPALCIKNQVYDWEWLRKSVSQLADWLQKNTQRGDRVATWAAKGELTCLMPLAASRAGVVHVPINPLLKRAQAAHILADSGSVLLLANSARLQSLADGDVPEGCTAVAEGDVWQQARECGGIGPSPFESDFDELAAILYTSGSTGKPKGVMLSHTNLWLGAVSVAEYLRLQADDVTLAVLPLSFDYGQNQLLSTWLAGGCVAALDYLTPRDVIKACAKHRVTTLAAVPPLWVQLVEQDWPQDASMSLRRFTNSGGALTPRLVKALRETFPKVDLYPMYGLTEAFRSTYLAPHLVDQHPTSMGKAIPFAEVLVVREDGSPADAGEEGELVHCGPLVAQGYWQDKARTEERFKPAPAHSEYGGTAVWSGDRVVKDSEGLLYFVGRLDAMIKTSGNRVSPQDIEDAVMATGLVSQAAAKGVPDERLGQAIALYVQAAESLQGEGDTAAAEQQLRAALKRELPNFMQPQRIHWLSIMPLNPNGKIDRAALGVE